MTERTCSYEVPASRDEVSGAEIASHPCGEPAKWEVWGNTGSADSCTAHVGALLDEDWETTVAPIRTRGMAGDPGLARMR